jgi:hypothetical protein
MSVKITVWVSSSVPPVKKNNTYHVLCQIGNKKVTYSNKYKFIARLWALKQVFNYTSLYLVMPTDNPIEKK